MNGLTLLPPNPVGCDWSGAMLGAVALVVAALRPLEEKLLKLSDQFDVDDVVWEDNGHVLPPVVDEVGPGVPVVGGGEEEPPPVAKDEAILESNPPPPVVVGLI